MRLPILFLAGCLISGGATYAGVASKPSLERINVLSAQIVPYAAKDPLNRYHAYKAKMWLSYALNQSSEEGWTSAGQEALEQAQRIADQLATVQKLDLTTPVLSVSQVMRRDLWLQAEYLKQQGAIQKAPESLAHAEVMLVWAAAEYCELGWRHANAHFKAAEQALHEASERSGIYRATGSADVKDLPSLHQLNGKGCNGVNATLWPLLKKQPQAETAVPMAVHNIVHFALDSAQLSFESQKILDQLSALLHAHPQIDVLLSGYTDPRANMQYNLALAERRIRSVKDYLLARHVDTGRMSEAVKGAQDFVQDQNSQIADAKSRRVVLELNNTGELNIQLEPQVADLQIENRN